MERTLIVSYCVQPLALCGAMCVFSELETRKWCFHLVTLHFFIPPSKTRNVHRDRTVRRRERVNYPPRSCLVIFFPGGRRLFRRACRERKQSDAWMWRTPRGRRAFSSDKIQQSVNARAFVLWTEDVEDRFAHRVRRRGLGR